uniref:Uncharacterized protein n=1 Tax=Ciona savignyi TaxID=51511 RepID=H2ZFE3_CIOSA
ASSTFTAIADKSPLVEIETYTAYEDHETDYSTKTYPDTMEVTP